MLISDSNQNHNHDGDAWYWENITYYERMIEPIRCWNVEETMASLDFCPRSIVLETFIGSAVSGIIKIHHLISAPVSFDQALDKLTANLVTFLNSNGSIAFLQQCPFGSWSLSFPAKRAFAQVSSTSFWSHSQLSQRRTGQRGSNRLPEERLHGISNLINNIKQWKDLL